MVASSYEWPPRLPLDWLRNQPWPVFVTTKEEGHVFFSESWGNKGDEVASFLRFIVDYWDTLPEYTAFVHGHDISWHQMGYSMQYILRNLCLEHLRTRRCVGLGEPRTELPSLRHGRGTHTHPPPTDTHTSLPVSEVVHMEPAAKLGRPAPQPSSSTVAFCTVVGCSSIQVDSRRAAGHSRAPTRIAASTSAPLSAACVQRRRSNISSLPPA